MKINKIFFTAIVMMLVSATVGAQVSASGEASGTISEKENEEVKAKIESLVHKLYESLKNKDLEKQKSFHLYSEDFTAFYGGLKRKDAAGAQEFEENLMQRNPENINFDIKDMQVNLFDNTALATFHIYVTTNGDEENKSKARLSLLYLKVNGEWKIIHEHVSPLTEE